MIGPSSSGSWRWNIGIALLWKGDFGPAIEKFQRVLELSPNRPKTYRLVGLAYQEWGKPQEARKWFEKARQIGQPGPRRR